MGYNLNLNTIIDTIFKLFADSFLIRETEDKYEIFEISSKQHASKKIRIVFSAPMYRKIQIGDRKARDSSAQNDISKCILIAEEKRIKNNKNGEKGTIEALLELVEKTTRDFFDLESHITETFINALKLERLIVEDDECIRNKMYVKKEKIEALTLLGEEFNIRLKNICREIQDMVSANMSNLLFEYHTYIEQSTISSWISALVVTSLLNDNFVCETKFRNVDKVEKNIVEYLLTKECIKKAESKVPVSENHSPYVEDLVSSSIVNNNSASAKTSNNLDTYQRYFKDEFFALLDRYVSLDEIDDVETLEQEMKDAIHRYTLKLACLLHKDKEVESEDESEWEHALFGSAFGFENIINHYIELLRSRMADDSTNIKLEFLKDLLSFHVAISLLEVKILLNKEAVERDTQEIRKSMRESKLSKLKKKYNSDKASAELAEYNHEQNIEEYREIHSIDSTK